MANLGVIQKFIAKHGTRKIRIDEFEVKFTLEGRLQDGFVAGIDHLNPQRKLSSLLSDLDGKYLDDIVGRATNENLASYLLYHLREFPTYSLEICEGDEQFVTLFKGDVDFDNFPANLCFSKAQSLLMRENPSFAKNELDAAISLRNDFAEAYNLRGRCHKYMGDYVSALQDYLQTVSINPSFGEAHRNIGNAHYYLDHDDLMISSFTKAIELMPNSALAYTNRGFGYQKLECFELALADQDRAIELDPNYEEAYRDRGESYRVLGKSDLSKKDIEKADELKETGKGTYSGIKMYC